MYIYKSDYRYLNNTFKVKETKIHCRRMYFTNSAKTNGCSEVRRFGNESLPMSVHWRQRLEPSLETIHSDRAFNLVSFTVFLGQKNMTEGSAAYLAQQRETITSRIFGQESVQPFLHSHGKLARPLEQIKPRSDQSTVLITIKFETSSPLSQYYF